MNKLSLIVATLLLSSINAHAWSVRCQAVCLVPNDQGETVEVKIDQIHPYACYQPRIDEACESIGGKILDGSYEFPRVTPPPGAQ